MFKTQLIEFMSSVATGHSSLKVKYDLHKNIDNFSS